MIYHFMNLHKQSIKQKKNDNSDLDTLSEDEKWDIVDEEIEKSSNRWKYFIFR